MLKSRIFHIPDLGAVLLEITIQKNIALIVDGLLGLQNLLHLDDSDKRAGHSHQHFAGIFDLNRLILTLFLE